MKYFQVYSRRGCVMRPDPAWIRKEYSQYSCPRCNVILPQFYRRPFDVIMGASEFREDYPKISQPCGTILLVHGCHLVIMSSGFLEFMQSFGFRAGLGAALLGQQHLAGFVTTNAAIESRVFVYPNRVIRADSLCEGCGRTLHSADGNAGYHLLDTDVAGRNALVSMVSFRTVLSKHALESMRPDLLRDMVLDHVEVWNHDQHKAVWNGL